MTKKAGPGSVIRKKKGYKFTLLLCSMVASVVLGSKESLAVPAFARKYHTACSTCHLAFPVRNGFGEAFRNNGYRFPGDTDEEMIKEAPIQLGQEAYKNVFPDAIWPSDIPNMPSFGLLGTTKVSTLRKTSTIDPTKKIYKDTNFDSELAIYFAGTLDNHISYFGDFAVNNTTASAQLGRLLMLWNVKPGVNVALGDVGFPELFTLVTTQSNYGGANGYSTALPNPDKGIELRIAGDTGATGGYSLTAGVGRNTRSFAPNDPAIYPADSRSLTDSRFVRGTFKIGGNGLVSGGGGSLGNNAIGLDNAVVFGVNFFNSGQGSSTLNSDVVPVQATDGIANGISKHAYAGDITVNYGHFRAIGQYAQFTEVLNENLVTELDATGTPTGNILLPGTVNYGKRTALSLEGDYWLYPWLFGVMRYEHLQDNLNGKINKVIPGVGALIRANAKLGIEYVAVQENTLATLNTQAGNSINVYAQLGF